MSEMIERVAKAMCDASELRLSKGNARAVIAWRDVPPTVAEFYQAEARAAIAAMREPTDDMLRAGSMAPNYLEDQSSRRGCGNIFKAMIDTALEEGK